MASCYLTKWRLLISIPYCSKFSQHQFAFFAIWKKSRKFGDAKMFFSNVCHSAGFWSITLKRCCITNCEMLFLVMGFIYFVEVHKFIIPSIVYSRQTTTTTKQTKLQEHQRHLNLQIIQVIGVCQPSQSAPERKKKSPQTFAHLVNFSNKCVCHV